MDEMVRVCEVANEAEAAMVITVLTEAGIEAHSDASPAGPAFGGLPFESGHGVYVPAASAHQARKVLEHYPHFKPSPETPEH